MPHRIVQLLSGGVARDERVEVGLCLDSLSAQLVLPIYQSLTQTPMVSHCALELFLLDRVRQMLGKRVVKVGERRSGPGEKSE